MVFRSFFQIIYINRNSIGFLNKHKFLFIIVCKLYSLQFLLINFLFIGKGSLFLAFQYFLIVLEQN